jgi:hypothetical protein
MHHALIPQLRQHDRIDAGRAHVRADAVNRKHRQREQDTLAKVRDGKDVADAVDEILDHDFAIPLGDERTARGDLWLKSARLFYKKAGRNQKSK